MADMADISAKRLLDPALFATRENGDYDPRHVPPVFGGVLPQDMPALLAEMEQERIWAAERAALLESLRCNHA